MFIVMANKINETAEETEMDFKKNFFAVGFVRISDNKVPY